MEAHQLFATFFGAIGCFDQHRRGFRANRRLDLRRADRHRARPACEPQQLKAAPLQQLLRLIRETGRRGRASLEGARKATLLRRLFHTGAVGADPGPTARQLRGYVRRDDTIRRQRETDQPRSVDGFMTDDAAPLIGWIKPRNRVLLNKSIYV
jgi:hypothetical protein